MSDTKQVLSDFDKVTEIVQLYFYGLHQGDVGKLRSIFHVDVWLKTPGKRLSLEQWLTDVTHRPSPTEQGKPFEFKILSIDVVQDQAMVKIQCPLFDFDYIDFLGLLKEQDQWLIVNKMYTDVQGKSL
jgi:hypothetical protein